MNPVCRQMIELLIDFVDRTLPPDREAEFRQHIDECPPCFVYLETYQVTIRLTRALPKDDPLPSEFERRLRALVAAEQEGGGGGAVSSGR